MGSAPRYIVFLQIPLLPELYCRAFGFRVFVNTLRRSSRAGTFSATDFEKYRRAWIQPGALRGMIDWYRALRLPRRRPTEDRERSARIEVPTLVLWGARDAFFEKNLAEKSVEYCIDGKLEVFPENTHWIHHEAPDQVSKSILHFLSGE